MRIFALLPTPPATGVRTMPVTSACRSKMIPDPQPMLCQCSANGMQVSCDSVQMVFPHRLESLESRDPFNAWKEWKVSDLHASNSEKTPKSTSKTSIQHARVPESRQHPSAHSELTACQHAVWNVPGLTRHHPPGDRAELLFIHQLGTGRTAAHTIMFNLAVCQNLVPL